MTGSPHPGAKSRLRDADRLVLVGTSGAGKTTMAKRIARSLDMPHVEFDGIRHGPNWTETPTMRSGTCWAADYRVTGGSQTAITASRGMSSGPGRLRWSGWTFRSGWSCGGCSGGRCPGESSARNCGTATQRGSGGTSSAVNRSFCGRCRPIGAGAGRYRQPWPKQSTLTWTWSTCVRREKPTNGSWLWGNTEGLIPR